MVLANNIHFFTNSIHDPFNYYTRKLTAALLNQRSDNGNGLRIILVSQAWYLSLCLSWLGIPLQRKCVK